jgi:fucose 4-O-acetylase-like acetyltransferase
LWRLSYNLFAVLVTFSLNSMWHSILDNFRPMTVWLTDLMLYAATHGSFGESWTRYSWIELAGLSVLLYGTAIYNAPDTWSIELRGQCFTLGINLEAEYLEIQERQLSALCSYPSIHRFLSQKSLRATGSGNLRSLPDV